jgi:hypothetical protein
VEERTSNGPYSGVDDLITRVGRLSRERMARFSQHMDFGQEPSTSDPEELTEPN